MVLLVTFETMTTVHLKIKKSALKRFMKMLQQFEPNEIELISENEDFTNVQAELDQDLQASKTEKAYSIEEADQILEDVIATYEGRAK